MAGALVLEMIALMLALLLPRWLGEVVPSTSQVFVLFLMGALTGYLAEVILRGPRPMGYLGSILAGMMGAWVGSNVLPGAPSWDWAISTSQGNVPIITSTVLALGFALLWRGSTNITALNQGLAQGRQSITRWLRDQAEGSLDNGLFTGFLAGTTLGWGSILAYSLYQQPEEASFFTWVLVALLVALMGYCWWRLLRVVGFHVPGRPTGRWWGLATAGLAIGLVVFGTGLLILAL
jgi:uncharacterized membrane protein YeaQ/YmgE (transglycosylase-associated protein family)